MLAKPGAPGSIRIDLESVTFGPSLFLLGTVAVVFGLVAVVWTLNADSSGPMLAAGFVALLFGVPLTFVGYKRWRSGANHLLVDIAGDTVHLIMGREARSCALESLDMQAVEKYKHRNSYGRYMQDRYRIAAPGLNVYLVDTASEPGARRLYERVDALVTRAAIRKVLGAPSDDGAFRGAPEVVGRIRAVMPDEARLSAALDELERDHDDHIRRTAKEARKAIASSQQAGP